MSAMPAFTGANGSLTQRQGEAIVRDPETEELLAFVRDSINTGAADSSAWTTPEDVRDFFRSRQ